jgi:hypothetical protein
MKAFFGFRRLAFPFSQACKTAFEYPVNFSSQGIPIGKSRNEKPVAAVFDLPVFGQFAFEESQINYGPSEIYLPTFSAQNPNVFCQI